MFKIFGSLGHVMMANMWVCVVALTAATFAAAFLHFGNTAALLGSVASIMLMVRSEGQQPTLVAAEG